MKRVGHCINICSMELPEKLVIYIIKSKLAGISKKPRQHWNPTPETLAYGCPFYHCTSIAPYLCLFRPLNGWKLAPEEKWRREEGGILSGFQPINIYITAHEAINWKFHLWQSNTYISHVCISDIQIRSNQNKLHFCISQVTIPANSMQGNVQSTYTAQLQSIYDW